MCERHVLIKHTVSAIQTKIGEFDSGLYGRILKRNNFDEKSLNGITFRARFRLLSFKTLVFEVKFYKILVSTTSKML